MKNKQSQQKTCIYCGRRASKIKKGEHVVPKTIGGVPTIKSVCTECNTGILSDLDRELCSRSPLSVIASQEINNHIWQVWDVDHSANNLLLEARPDWSAQSLFLYPQIIFESSGPQYRGDCEEVFRFGMDSFESVLVRSARRSLANFKAGRKRWLHFERIEPNPALLAQYRYRPRVFIRSSIYDLAQKLMIGTRASLIVRYLTESDKRFALNQIDNWTIYKRFRRFDTRLGSKMPAMRWFYDQEKVLRALAKMAVNLLAAHCPNTPVNRDRFQSVIKLVMGEVEIQPSAYDQDGFVDATDIHPISTQTNVHSFRLLHDRGWWFVYSSFFGGRIGSVIRFAGPNYERWSCAEVIAPIGAAEWTVNQCQQEQIYLPCVEWKDPTKIIPSVEMFNANTEIRVREGRI